MESHRHAPQDAPWKPSLTIIGSLASFSLVLVLVGVLFWVGNQGRTDHADKAATLQAESAKLRAEDKQRLESYGWVDKPKGVVHVPIERAMELLVADPKAFPEPPLPGPKQAEPSGKEPAAKQEPEKSREKEPAAPEKDAGKLP